MTPCSFGGEILNDLVFFFPFSLLFLGFLYYVAVGQHLVALIPLERIDAWKHVYGNVLRPVDYVGKQVPPDGT